MSKKPKWVEKAWGKVWNKFADDITNESLLYVKADHQSSIHFHNEKWNCFICMDATIVVEEFITEAGENKVASSTLMNPGDSHVVPPKKLHRFYVVKSGRVLEIYWSLDDHKCDPNDIVRIYDGGRRY
jgi:hypothetical protein